MMADVLISGTLFREPEQCTSESGRPFERATLKAKGGDNSQFWRLVPPKAFEMNR